MRHLPRDEAAAIYRRLYWLRPRFDEIAKRSPRIAAELFDTGVNMGPAVAVTFLQRALTALNRTGKDYPDLVPDGRIGPQRSPRSMPSWTSGAWTNSSGETVLLRALEALQGERYLRLAERRPANEAFLYGWLANRIGDAVTSAQIRHIRQHSRTPSELSSRRRSNMRHFRRPALSPKASAISTGCSPPPRACSAAFAPSAWSRSSCGAAGAAPRSIASSPSSAGRSAASSPRWSRSSSGFSPAARWAGSRSRRAATVRHSKPTAASMILLRLLNPQGIAGLAVSLALGFLLLIQKGETRHWKKQSGEFEQLYAKEQAALAGTVANYRAAADAARSADRANAVRVAAEQRDINERISNDYEARLAAARSVARRLRVQTASAAADPSPGGAAPMPGLSAAAGEPAEAAGEDRLPDADALVATEQAIQLDELIKWVRRPSRCRSNCESTAPRVSQQIAARAGRA